MLNICIKEAFFSTLKVPRHGLKGHELHLPAPPNPIAVEDLKDSGNKPIQECFDSIERGLRIMSYYLAFAFVTPFYFCQGLLSHPLHLMNVSVRVQDLRL